MSPEHKENLSRSLRETWKKDPSARKPRSRDRSGGCAQCGRTPSSKGESPWVTMSGKPARTCPECLSLARERYYRVQADPYLGPRERAQRAAQRVSRQIRAKLGT